MSRKTTPPSRTAGQDTVVLSDPRAIRAIAHPARVEIIRALYDGEEMTATECARLTGLSPSATSYHLKALERWGVVEAGELRPDGRDRPWRAKGRSLQINSEVLGGSQLAESAVVTAFLNQDRDSALSFVQRQLTEAPEWRDALNFMTGEHWMTPEELDEIVESLQLIVAEYRDRSRHNRPENSRRVRISSMTVPLEEREP